LLDAGDVISLLRQLSVDLVLSGHRHVSYVWPVAGMFIVHSGTVSTLRTRRFTHPAYNLIRVEDGRIAVELCVQLFLAAQAKADEAVPAWMLHQAQDAAIAAVADGLAEQGRKHEAALVARRRIGLPAKPSECHRPQSPRMRRPNPCRTRPPRPRARTNALERPRKNGAKTLAVRWNKDLSREAAG